ITRFVNRVKIVANCSEKLFANSVVDRQLRIELQRPVKADCSQCSELNIGRTQKEFVNRDQPRTEVIFCVCLFEMKLLEFLNLQHLTQQHEQSVLFNSPFAEEDFAFSGQRIRIASFSRGLKRSFQFALHHSFRAARISDNLIGEHIVEVYTGGEWRIFGL